MDTVIDEGIQLGFWDNGKQVEVLGKCELVQETLDDAAKIEKLWEAMPPRIVRNEGKSKCQ